VAAYQSKQRAPEPQTLALSIVCQLSRPFHSLNWRGKNRLMLLHGAERANKSIQQENKPLLFSGFQRGISY